MQLRQLPAKVVAEEPGRCCWHSTLVLLLFQLLWINTREQELRCPPPRGKILAALAAGAGGGCRAECLAVCPGGLRGTWRGHALDGQRGSLGDVRNPLADSHSLPSSRCFPWLYLMVEEKRGSTGFPLCKKLHLRSTSGHLMGNSP